ARRETRPQRRCVRGRRRGGVRRSRPRAHLCLGDLGRRATTRLAAAALLSHRVAAVAALVPVAPYDAEGLDFFEGMGEQNVEEFKLVFEGEAPHRASLERDREELLSISPDQLVDTWQTLLGPADREVATGVFAESLLEHIRAGI